MGFIIIIPFAALFGWIIFAIFRWLRNGGYERKWWRAYSALSAAGFVLGIWLALFSRYTVAKMRLEGFPIPIVIVSPNQTADSKFEMPATVRIGAIITDVLGGMAICLAPIAVATFFRENKMKGPPGRTRPANSP